MVVAHRRNCHMRMNCLKDQQWTQPRDCEAVLSIHSTMFWSCRSFEPMPAYHSIITTRTQHSTFQQAERHIELRKILKSEPSMGFRKEKMQIFMHI